MEWQTSWRPRYSYIELDSSSVKFSFYEKEKNEMAGQAIYICCGVFLFVGSFQMCNAGSF